MRYTARRALWSGAAASLVLACAHDYRDPDPAAGPTARVVIENPSAESVYISMTAAAVHVYEANPECVRTYLGTVSIADPGWAILLAADRSALLQLSIVEEGRHGTRSCDVAIGFVPQAGETYRLITREGFQHRCIVELRNASGQPVEAFDPRDCRTE